MKVAWVLPCRHIEQLQDGTFALMGVVSDIRVVSELPTTVVVPLLVNLRAAAHDADSEHRVHAVVTNPEMEPITDPLDATFQVSPGTNSLPGWGGSVIFPMRVEFEAITFGPYSIDVRVDDEPPYSTPIIVAEQKQSG